MKKMSCFILFLMFLMLVVPVKALEKESIEVVSIMQGEKELVQDENGIYQVDNYDKIIINFKFHNIKKSTDENYFEYEYLYTSNGNGGNEYLYEYDGSVISRNVYLNPYNEITDINIDLYIDDELLDKKNIKLRFSKLEELDFVNSKVNLVSVFQGGEIISAVKEDNYIFNVNDVEDVILELKGENLVDDLIYNITGLDYIDYSFTGLELENGVYINAPIYSLKESTNDFEWDLYLRFGIDVFDEVSKQYIMFDNSWLSYYFKTFKQDNVENYEFNLYYDKYPNVSINKPLIGNHIEEFVVEPMYHNKDSLLGINIDGNNYLDKDYLICLSIISSNKEIYNKEISVDGNDLNNGYKLLLDKYFTEYINIDSNNFQDGVNEYEIIITVGETTKKINYVYAYNSMLRSRLFYKNGERTMIAHLGWGNYYGNGQGYHTHKKTFEIDKVMYFHYVGKNFINTEIYDYEYYYGYDEGNRYKTLVKSGKVSGLVLNTIGMAFQIDNKDNYRIPYYELIIKKDGDIVQVENSSLRMIDYPTLTTATIESRNKNVYYQMNDDKYIATRNGDLDVVVNGIGFNDEEKYDVIISVYDRDIDINEPNEFYYEYEFTGYEINNNLAKVTLPSKKYYDNTRIMFTAMDELETLNCVGGINVNYVDSLDLFDKITSYVIDNTEDLIKNIKKKTSVEELNNNLDIVDNGSVKIFDKTGVNEVDGNVGTGMIARVVDEYERSLLDMDVVVKGDITGDGNISITDLIKVRQHLANIEKLDGVYEMAGDTTDTGKISITDLIKIRQDLAKIKEME